MAIIRPRTSTLSMDPLLDQRRKEAAAREANLERSAQALTQAWLRQVAIDDALAKMDARREAAVQKRNKEVAGLALRGLGSADMSADYDAGVRAVDKGLDAQREEGYNLSSGAAPTLGGARNVNLGAAPRGRTGPTYRNALMQTLSNASLASGQRINDLADHSADVPLSLYNDANVGVPGLDQALANLAVGTTEAVEPSLLSGYRPGSTGEVVDPRPQMARQKRMDLVAAAGDRSRYAPPNLDPYQKAAIEQALAVLTSGNIDAGSSMGEARGMGRQQRNVPEDMMQDRLQRILNQEYFGTEQDRVGNLLGILERVRSNEPLTPDEQMILDNFLMFERSGQRPPARGGSQQIGPLRRSEMVGE